MRTPLARNGPLRAWWSRVAVPLGLAEYRPILANRRRAFTVWELASRGGAPVLAVNWWATYPAEPLPGAGGGPRRLSSSCAEGAEARWRRPRQRRGSRRSPKADRRPPPRSPRRPCLPPRRAGARRALRPDLFYRRVFARRRLPPPRAAALYLPGLDIAADGWRGGDVAFADLVRSELAAADRLLAPRSAGAGTVVVV